MAQRIDYEPLEVADAFAGLQAELARKVLSAAKTGKELAREHAGPEVVDMARAAHICGHIAVNQFANGVDGIPSRLEPIELGTLLRFADAELIELEPASVVLLAAESHYGLRVKRSLDVPRVWAGRYGLSRSAMRAHVDSVRQRVSLIDPAIEEELSAERTGDGLLHIGGYADLAFPRPDERHWYTATEREGLTQQLLWLRSRGMTIASAARTVGLPYNTAHHWLHILPKDQAAQLTTSYGSASQEGVQIIRFLAAGKTRVEICELLGLRSYQVDYRLDAVRQQADDAPDDVRSWLEQHPKRKHRSRPPMQAVIAAKLLLSQLERYGFDAMVEHHGRAMHDPRIMEDIIADARATLAKHESL